MAQKKLVTQQLLSKELKRANEKASDSFDFYKKTMEIVRKTNVAMGKTKSYSSTQNSTLNYKIGIHGFSSTQKI